MHFASHWLGVLRRIVRIALCASGLLVSCTDDRYDLGDIDTEMTFGADGIALPLGSVDRKTVRDLLIDSGMDTLRLDTDDGYYAYRIDGSIRDTIAAVSIRPLRDVIPAFDPCRILLSDDLQGGGDLTATVRMERSIGYTFELVDEVAGIDFAEVLDDDTGAEVLLVIDLDFADMPFGECRFEGIRIGLPDFLVVRPCPGYDAATHTLFVEQVRYGGGPTRVAVVPIEGIRNVSVSTTEQGREGALEGDLKVSTEVRIPADRADSPEREFELRCIASLSPLRLVRMTGRTDMDLDKYLTPEEIDCGDLGESLGEGRVELNLVAPQIMLEVSNPLGFALVGDICLEPRDAEEVFGTVTIRDVRVEPATEEGPRTTRLYVTDGDSAPEGYELCQAEELAELVRIVPSRIDVSFDLQPDDTQSHSLDLTGEPYDVAIDYVLRMPLAFRSGARVEFSDSEDVSDTFEDLDVADLSAEEVFIRFDARSTLPLALEPAIEFRDAADRPVEGVSAVTDGRLEAYDASSGEPWRESRFGIRLEVADGDLGRLKEIARLSYRFTGEATASEAALAPDQYIEADLVLELGRGITVEL